MNQLQAKTESRALYFGGGALGLALVLALVQFWGGTAALFGKGSIGELASVLAAVAAFVGFMLTYHRQSGAGQPWWRRARMKVTDGALGLTHAAIFLLLVVVAYYLGQAAFVGVSLDYWTAACLVGLTVGLAAYAAYLAGGRLTSERLSVTLAVFLVSGALASMISAPNPYWWQLHFSSLGAGQSASAVAFNLTLIIGGLVVVGLADFIVVDFARWQRARHHPAPVKANVIRTLLVIIGVFLACVGLFPYDTNLTMHNLAAAGMALIFYGLIVALPWLAPGFPKVFYGFSYAVFAALIACTWLLFGVGYLNVTAFELLTAGLIFVWLVVFVRQIAAGVADIRSVHNG